MISSCSDSETEPLENSAETVITVVNNSAASLTEQEEELVKNAPMQLLRDPSKVTLNAIEEGAGDVFVSDLRSDQNSQSLLALYKYPLQELADGRIIEPVVICGGQFEPLTFSECTESPRFQMRLLEFGEVEANHESLTPDFANELLTFVAKSDLTTSSGEKFTILTVSNIQYNPVDDVFHIFGWADSGKDFFVTLQQETKHDVAFSIVDWSCE